MTPEHGPGGEPIAPVTPPPWPAELSLRFHAPEGRSVLAAARHRGPLRLQKTLADADGGCQALILHPPGGIAGGDTLQIDVEVEPGAQLLVSTPGASKWYRSNGRGAAQQVRLRIGRGASLDWLPQESVLFREADATQLLRIDLATDARHIGWDVVQLGRLAAGEVWDAGRLRQSLDLFRDDRLVWQECADIAAEDPQLDGPATLAGQRVFGTLWAAAPALAEAPDAALAQVRDVLHQQGADGALPSPRGPVQSRCCAAATWLAAPAEVLVVRALGDDVEAMRSLFEAVWLALRQCLHRPATRPRIWST